MSDVGQIGARLDRLPIAKFHYKILGLIGLGLFFDAFGMYLASGVLGALVKSGWSNLSLNAVFISTTFIGLAIGSLAAGFVADHLGRKFSFQLNLLLFGLASFAAALAPNMKMLILFRGIMGVGLGAVIVVGYSTFSEFVPARARGRWGALLAVITNCALAFSALAAYFIIPSFSWRGMFVIVGIGAIFVWLLRKNMPESPRWYAEKGKFEQAETILKAIEKEIETEKGLLPPVITSNTDTEAVVQHGSFLDLFKGGMIRNTVIASLLIVVINTGVYTFISWLPTIFIKQGINISTSLGYTAVMMMGGPVGALVASLLLDKVGRKWASTFIFILAGAVGYIYAIQSNPSLLLLLGFVLVTLIYYLVAMTWGSYVPELFPTKVRMRGTGLANATGRIAMIFTPYGVAWLLGSYGPKSVFISIAIGLGIMGLILGIWGIETKNKSLEEI